MRSCPCTGARCSRGSCRRPSASSMRSLRRSGSRSSTAASAWPAAAVWVNRLEADQPFSLGFAVRETSRALVGLSVRGSAHLADPVGRWFPPSVLLLGAAGAGVLIHAWLSPARYRHRQGERERALA